MTDKNKLVEFLDDTIQKRQALKDVLNEKEKIEYQDYCIAMLIEIKGTVEGEIILRRLLWFRHGCSHPALYGDDGQMDCNSCIIDFKDTPAKDIESRFQRIGELKLKQQQPQPDDKEFKCPPLPPKPQPPGDDLIEKIMDSIDRGVHEEDGYCRDTVEEEISKLLQSRQPERVTITRAEIKALVFGIQSSKFSASMNATEKVFKSKGLEVVEK